MDISLQSISAKELLCFWRETKPVSRPLFASNGETDDTTTTVCTACFAKTPLAPEETFSVKDTSGQEKRVGKDSVKA